MLSIACSHDPWPRGEAQNDPRTAAEPRAPQSAVSVLDLETTATGAGLRAPELRRDNLAGLNAAIEAQCGMRRPPSPWEGLCGEWRNNRQQLHAWLETRFEPRLLRSANGRDRGLITGYYEPELSGSRERESASQVPLLGRPGADSPVWRWTREQIDNATTPPAEVIAWLDDPVAAYFLQIQGSGRIQLRDRSVLRVGYAGDNGMPYHAIGRDLIERGVLTAATLSAQAIGDWLRENPAQGRALMHRNRRYVFMAPMPAGSPGRDGPVGSLGVRLTPLRSVAVDPRMVPPGSLLWLEVADPRGGVLRRLVVAQDSGAAIVGSPRADLFWGTGTEAGKAAGLMKTEGRLWLLVPRPAQ